MTSWTKETDSTTSYTGVTDSSTSYTNVSDGSDIWAAFGGLIHLVTEGLRELLMTEGDTDYIVVSKGVESGTWTDEADASTSYTKVSDA